MRTAASAGLSKNETRRLTSKQITEVNMSCYVFNCRDLLDSLDRIGRHNAQGEYYITDCPGVLKQEGKLVEALAVLQPCEALSINTVDELAIVE